MIKVLFLDDDEIRVPVIREDEVFVFVRNAEEYKQYLQEHGVPDVISFDCDLAADHYVVSTGYSNPPSPNQDGVDCAVWTVDNGFVPKRAIVHSWNAAKAQRVKQVLEEVGCEVFVRPFQMKDRHIPLQWRVKA